MRLILSLILVFAWTFKGINAQNTNNSVDFLAPFKKAIILQKKVNKQLALKELAAQRPGRPIQFATCDTLSANIYNSGSWSSYNDQKELWTLKIESKGALSINLGFAKFFLPEQTDLTIYNKAKTFQIGPLTNEDNDEHLQFWTPIIKGDVVVLELLIPIEKKDELLLELNYVNHDFLGFGRSFSGSCNLDVICGEEDGYEMVDLYRDIIQSVGAYHINGIEACSGALINNTNQDKRAYFLTADHCNITETNAASVVTYWNYQNSYCRLPNTPESGTTGDGNLNQFNSGSILRANNEDSDFCLIEFDDPIKPEFNPYFSGWDRDFQSTEMAICIHHPGVEEKRISFEFNGVSNESGNFIEVSDWDEGTTEGGSSGAPLYSKDKKIIGQLRGGLAACSNDLSDRFGSFNVSWTGNGTPSTSLQSWLDPENIGLTSLDGFQGSFGLDIVNNFQNICSLTNDSIIIKLKVQEEFVNFVNIEVNNIPAPLQLVSFEENLSPGSETELIFTNLSGLSSGEYNLILISTDGTNTVENQFTFSIDDALPQALLPLSPVNEFAEATNEQIIEWMALAPSTYNLEVSTDSDFNEIFFSQEGIDNNSFLLEGLSNESTYYWRVRAINACGVGLWSDVFQFTTQISYCLKLQSESSPFIIPDNSPGEFKFGLIINYPVIVESVSIPNVNLEHNYINDLDLELLNPETNQASVLLSQICDSENDFNLGFSDNGIIDLPCPPTDGNLYKPLDPLRNLKDINGQGLWELLVRDNVNFDGGVFNSWEIEVCFSETDGLALIPLKPELTTCEEEKTEIPFYYNLDGASASQVRIENALGLDLAIEEIALPLEGSGNLDIVLLDNSNLETGINELYFVIDNIIESVFYIELESIPSVEWDMSFAMGATIEALESISWEGMNVDNYSIEISTTSDFIDLEWSTNEAGNIENIDGPTLEDGDYYMRILAENNCGIFYTDLYNFSVDESVSILESTKKPLLISQSLAGDEILISGNSDNTKISVAVISISGHKLHSQTFIEASLLLDVSAFVPGVYLLELRSGEEQTIRKIVVY